jgi:hypothetical protein
MARDTRVIDAYLGAVDGSAGAAHA